MENKITIYNPTQYAIIVPKQLDQNVRLFEEYKDVVILSLDIECIFINSFHVPHIITCSNLNIKNRGYLIIMF